MIVLIQVKLFVPLKVIAVISIIVVYLQPQALPASHCAAGHYAGPTETQLLHIYALSRTTGIRQQSALHDYGYISQHGNCTVGDQAQLNADHSAPLSILEL
jgi:hypothetical protein